MDAVSTGVEPTGERLPVIAIDGPAGSGKSTVARRLAERLGLEYLDTGAMYRSVAFAAMYREVDLADTEAIVEVARTSDIRVDDTAVMVDGVDATTQIRGPEVTRSVSTVAAISGVREVLRVHQRAWAVERQVAACWRAGISARWCSPRPS